MSVLPSPIEGLAGEESIAPVLHLVPAHEHTWALRDTEYDNGFSLNRFECDACSAVRFT
jgi:hypothetical protein